MYNDSDMVVWCPAHVSVPTPGQDGCSPIYSNLSVVLGWLRFNFPSTAGTIWISKNYNSALIRDKDIVFDGAVLAEMAQFALTILGGWDGPGAGTVDTAAPSTFDGEFLTILNWKGDVVLKNIRVKNVTFPRTTYSCGIAALCVQTASNIQLDRVQVNGNEPLSGVYLDNTSSITAPMGSVTVTNSQFFENGFSGLLINTSGAVTLQNVAASGNRQQYGVYIFNAHESTLSPVTVTDGQFNANKFAGLSIHSAGMITLRNVCAQGNLEDGMIVDNTYGFEDVLLKGTNIFLCNGGEGLAVYSKGNVVAEHLVAYKNGHDNMKDGVYIDNSAAPLAKDVTITERGEFEGNGYRGLAIYSRGAITTNNLTATSNRGSGTYLTTVMGRTILSAVTLRGVNSFAGNGSHGLDLYSYSNGRVTLHGVNADANATFGISVHADGHVTLTRSGTYKNGVGLYVRAANGSDPLSKLTLQGFLSHLKNTLNEDLLTTDVIHVK
jgi:parallel beta helix pectate lyase-like protein